MSESIFPFTDLCSVGISIRKYGSSFYIGIAMVIQH